LNQSEEYVTEEQQPNDSKEFEFLVELEENQSVTNAKRSFGPKGKENTENL
jgi:hypothetical protein